MMKNVYQQLFRAPGSREFALAGLIARLPLPMMGIGIITMLAQLKGSYALAGSVSATFVLTYALLSPQVSRWVDRYGQFRILPLATLISVLGAVLILVNTWWLISDSLFFVGAVLTGFMPSMSAMVRARWSAIYKGQPLLQTAYSLETVLDEVTFIIGPPLSVGIAVMLFPQAGLLIAVIILLLGVVAFVMQRKSEPEIAVITIENNKPRWVMAQLTMQMLVLLMIAMGVIVGTVDIGSVALAEHLGQPAYASLVLSAYALGSCLMGLIFGGLTLKRSLTKLLLWGGAFTALSVLPLYFVTQIISLSLVVFVAGLFFAPTMIIAMSLVENHVTESQITEGMTWLLAGLNIGVAIGAVLSGYIVDQFGVDKVFLVAISAGLIVLMTVLIQDHFSRRLKY